MAKLKINKSEEVRQLLRANRKMKAKDVVAALEARGISVTEGLVYFIKGKLKGRRGRRRKMRQQVAQVVAATGNHDPLATILKVKGLAAEVGGMKKLKALVEALHT